MVAGIVLKDQKLHTRLIQNVSSARNDSIWMLSLVQKIVGRCLIAKLQKFCSPPWSPLKFLEFRGIRRHLSWNFLTGVKLFTNERNCCSLNIAPKGQLQPQEDIWSVPACLALHFKRWAFAINEMMHLMKCGTADHQINKSFRACILLLFICRC